MFVNSYLVREGGRKGVRLRPREPVLSLPKGLKPEGLTDNLTDAGLTINLDYANLFTR